MAIPQWVSGTRLYPLVPPLPVLLESVTSGPPPFRGKTECIPRPVDDGKYGKPYTYASTTTIPSSRTRTGYVSTGMYAGRVSARPVWMSKRAP